MAKQNKPLPNPLDNVLRTGTVGGNTKDTATENQIAVNTDIQPVVNTDSQPAVNTDSQPAQKPIEAEEKIKQTLKLRASLVTRVKIYVAKHRSENLSTVTEKALEQFLDQMENS